MRLSAEDTLTVLRWLAGEDVHLPPALLSPTQSFSGWRKEAAPPRGRTLYDLFGRDEVERLSQCLYETESSLTGNWLVVTLSKTTIPHGIDDGQVAMAVAQAVNSCMESLMKEDHSIFSPRAFVAKAIDQAVAEAEEAARIKEGRR